MGTLRDKNLPAHIVEKGNSRIDGPYLDDINKAREDAYVNSRVKKEVPVEESTQEADEAEVLMFPQLEEKEADDN